MSKKNTSVENLLTEENKAKIVTAIELAEKNSSGEIRVHLENYLPKKQTALERATEVFYQLKMDQTSDHNGMLIYAAVLDRHFAILGDSGINEKVGQHFWDNEKEQLVEYFKADRLIEGLVHFIEKAGEKLKDFFPYQKNDVNELSDEISVGDNL